MQIITTTFLSDNRDNNPINQHQKEGFAPGIARKLFNATAAYASQQANGLPKRVAEFGIDAAARVVVRLYSSTGSCLLHGVVPQPTLLVAGTGCPGLPEKSAFSCT